MIRRVTVGFLVVSALIGAGPASARAAEGPSQAEIDSAIARGVAFLQAKQEPKGEWIYSFNHNHELGITALAALALLENGIASTDPRVVKAGYVVTRLAKTSNQTYDLALAILFLARVQKEQSGANDALIRRLAARLAGGSDEGFWTYEVPIRTAAEEEEGSAPTKSSRRRRFRSVIKAGDNSNTQFALLGFWAAGRHGFDPNDPLESIEENFRSTQDVNGRWGYVPGDQGHDSMTCAGLMALAIAAARPALAERQTARARGEALAADPVFASALKAVSRDATAIGPESDVYYLWSLERVCVALGLRDLDGLDWYAQGARELLRRQRNDGGWPDERWGSLPNTCLALLFLRKANLAFELDRVLRLPAKGSLKKVEPVEVVSAPVTRGESPSDAAVIVTGSSDGAFPEISVDFEVKRPDGSFLLDAGASDFRVTEDGVSVPILRFQSPTAREARPITVVLVLDRSRSMEEEDRIGGLKHAVATFLKALPKGSRVAVVAFGTEVENICPFTGDFARAEEAVNRLTPAGATRYYDAVAESLKLIEREPGRRAILAMTDGEDTFSQDATPASLIATARRLGLPIHTLGLGSEDEIESATLRQLAQETRGQYYPARQADQLRSIYEQIATRLRSGYTLVYQTDRKIPDGTLRPIRILYRASRQAGETTVFVPGMVVPAPGWPRLFLLLVVGLWFLAMVPGRIARNRGRTASKST